MNELDHLRRTADVVRRSMPSYHWDEFASRIAAERTGREADLRKPEQDLDRTLFDNLQSFRDQGALMIPLQLGPPGVAMMRDHLEAQSVYAGFHVWNSDRKQRPLATVRKESPTAGYTMDQLLRTPLLLDLFNHPSIVDFLELHFGCVPTLYSINAWWAFPSSPPKQTSVQLFHRDNDDWRFCVLFLYLTDTDSRTGAHQYIPGSHTFDGMSRLVREAGERGRNTAGFDIEDSFVNHFGEPFSRRCEELFGDRVATIEGEAGSMFLVNTLALHRGLVPVAAPRLMAWARFGFGPNTNSADMEQGPLVLGMAPSSLPATPRNRYVNRLLLRY